MEIANFKLLDNSEGNILWVRLQSDIKITEAEAIAAALQRTVPEGIIPLVTLDSVVADVKMSNIDSIRAYRNSLDEIISALQLADEYNE